MKCVSIGFCTPRSRLLPRGLCALSWRHLHIRRPFSLVLLCVFSLCCAKGGYAASGSAQEYRVISPAPGVWNNRQVLVVETNSGKDNVFYSLDGSDSAVSGFAYDGPVLLDKDGEVSLDISVQVNNSGYETSSDKKYNQKINYTVQDVPMPEEPFLATALATGFIDCVAGESISIPSTYRYSIDGGGEETGRAISCPKENVLTRMSRLELDDGDGHHYSFVLRMLPVATGDKLDENSAKLPFSITGWNNVNLNDERSIYSIDGGMWLSHTRGGDPIVLDRTNAHAIYWQTAAYKPGNEIKSFYIPPSPHLYTSTGRAGDVSISVKDEGYAIGVETGGEVYLRKSVVLDTVYADAADGTFPVRMYYKGMYHGSIAIPYNIDRCRPKPPVIESPVVSGGNTRQDVNVTVTGERGSLLYVAVDDGEYIKVKGGGAEGIAPSKTVLLEGGAALTHKVAAYCVDQMGNKSDAAEYSVVIDKCRYFVDEVNGKSGALGGADDPCASIAECFLQGGKMLYITVRGNAHITGEVIERIRDASSDVTMIGEKGDEHLFIDGTLIAGGKLLLKNLIIQRGKDTRGKDAHGNGTRGNDTQGKALYADGANGYISCPLIASNNASLSLVGCEVYDEYDKSGIVIHCDGGSLCVNKSGVTSLARMSAAGISTLNTDVKMTASRVSSNAMESVGVSCFGGNVEIDGSLFRATGQRAHGVELFCTKSRVTNNTLEADLKDNGTAIYCGEQNEAIDHSGNIERGW